MEKRNAKFETRNSGSRVDGGMSPRTEVSNRREFLQQSAAALALTGITGTNQVVNRDEAGIVPGTKLLPAIGEMQDAAFGTIQKERRKELWGLLGDLPTQ